MTSISGKTDIDWAAFAQRLAPVEIIDEPVLVKNAPGISFGIARS